MTAIANKSANTTVSATEWNLIAGALNAVNGRAIFTSSGMFNWPAGVNRIKVTLCGGSGKQGEMWYGPPGSTLQPGSAGGSSPMCSSIISGVDAGTAIAVTIGVAGTGSTTGGTTSFGTYFSSLGGHAAAAGVQGTNGTHTGEIQHTNKLFVASVDSDYGPMGYGEGFPKGSGYNRVGGPGICVIEW